VIAAGSDWQVVHVPTHANHFYDVHRFEFSGTVEAETGDSCHVMSLVEGQRVLLETSAGERASFNYAETFVIPAAAGSYRLISPDGEALKVVKTFVKPRAQWVEGVVPDEQPGR
jgi:mannose-6-phosphate isomerase class I